MRFRLIALDLDGTLMDETRVIPPRTRRAVQAAMEEGCLVTIATGRAFVSAAHFARELSVNAPLICYQGALIRDYRDGNTVHVSTVPVPLAREVAAFSQERNLNVQVYLDDDRAYAAEMNPTIAQMSSVSGVPVTAVGSLSEWLSRPPVKFLFVEHEETILDLVRDLRAQFNGQLQVVRSWDRLVEVTGPQVSKGDALARLAAYLAVPQSATLAIGDQDNDVSMISWAGLGVAMGDASPSAKSAADVLAPSLAAQGAAWAIEHYVLEGRSLA